MFIGAGSISIVVTSEIKAVIYPVLINSNNLFDHSANS